MPARSSEPLRGPADLRPSTGEPLPSVRAVLALVALAVVPRLVWVLVVPSKPVGDFAMYVESAAYLVEHGALDPEFVYMPGYVLLLAAIKAVGGGLLAAKLVGVAFAGLGTAAVVGVAGRLFDRPAAVVAGALHALWPAGIALASVTGTDVPAAALVMAALFFLVRWGPQRPGRAAVAFGLTLGVASYVRAVALPLAVVSAAYWLARRAGWREATARTALAVAAALLVLSPWAVRNRVRYGEWFVTDSHGGHTALVGANPNSEGVYTRSLNRMFTQATGFRLLAEPHRAADRAAYALARNWTGFEPAYATGLVAAKADRLLGRQRGLLYWPIFRPGVLRQPHLGFFVARRAGLDALIDGYWLAVVALALVGAGAAAVRRDLPPLSLVAFAGALAAVYSVFFAEPRYQVPLVLLLLPLAASGICRLRSMAADRSQALGAAAAVVLTLVAWAAFVRGGAALRASHRWAVSLCRVDGADRICKWRAVDRSSGASPVRGAIDGVGLRAPGAAEVALELPSGWVRLRARLEPPEAAADRRIAVQASGGLAHAAEGPPGAVEVVVQHTGGPLRIRLAARPGAPLPVWLADVALVRTDL